MLRGGLVINKPTSTAISANLIKAKFPEVSANHITGLLGATKPKINKMNKPSKDKDSTSFPTNPSAIKSDGSLKRIAVAVCKQSYIKNKQDTWSSRFYNSNNDFALARPVQLDQDNTLPVTQLQLAILERNCQAWADGR